MILLCRVNKMMRYDPTADNHGDFEITSDKLNEQNISGKKRKKKSNIVEIEPEKEIPRSKEMFFNVSENLVENLKQNEEFSLLNSFGRGDVSGRIVYFFNK